MDFKSHMKTLSSIAAIGLGSLIMAFTPIFEKEEISLKPAASSIEWHAEKITGSHSGTIALKKGNVIIENEKLTGGTFIIDMSTIVVTDIDGAGKTKLEGHLNSKDFFNTKEFNESSFVITSVNETKLTEEGFNTEITGKLTIKGISNEVSFPAKVEVEKGKFAAYGEMTVDRTKFDISYGSASFFDNLGDRAIYDDFTLKISLGGLKN